MKKLVTLTILTLFPLVGMAKVSDFNAMISDNLQAQKELHHSVAESVDVARRAKPQEKVVVVEEGSSSYNAPTNKDLLTFAKEKNQHQVTQKVQFDRLANELNDSEL